MTRKTAQTLYKNLLSLYPKAFRDRLGESMEQTFNDCCNEWKQRTEQGFSGFVLWMFVETSIGIIKERVLVITKGDAMKTISMDLKLAAIISFVLMLPFAILESLNNTLTRQNVPGLLLLFGILWLLPTIFILLLIPIVRTMRAGNSIMANPITLSFRVAFLALTAAIWIWGFTDQLPCFLGVPNCD